MHLRVNKKRTVAVLSPESDDSLRSKKTNSELVTGEDLDTTEIVDGFDLHLDMSRSPPNDPSSVDSVQILGASREVNTSRNEINSCLREILFGEEYKSMLNDYFRHCMEPFAHDITILKGESTKASAFRREAEAKIFELEVKIDIMEQHEKSTQLIIQNNWPETKGEVPAAMLLNFFGSVLNIDMDKSCIINAFRIGKVSRPSNIPLNSTNMGSPTRDDGVGSVAWFGETRPRPIFVKLSSGFLKSDIMRARAKLKNDDSAKHIYINEDLTSHRRKRCYTT